MTAPAPTDAPQGAIHKLDNGAGESRGLYYLYAPSRDGRQTFVFINALTGSTEQWESDIAPALRNAGFGTLSYNYRGQKESPFAPGDLLDPPSIVADFRHLMAVLAPTHPIVVGLSIGGLFGAQALLAGTPMEGLALLNTLRDSGTRLDWTNEAIFRAARLGGSQLVMDLFLPMLVGPKKLAELRATCLGDAPYEPSPPNSGLLRLIEASRGADWNFDWSRLDLPVLVMTGLCDRIFLDRDAVASIVDKLPKPYHVELPHAGHLIPAEDPHAVIDVLTRFAQDIKSA